ncbi:MAG: class I SAM-dependent methyltransferase [Armatimonadota bacterium]
MSGAQNYFSYETAAQRYARSRPYFHPLVIEKIRAYLQLEAPLSKALDVACGTGQSAHALTAIARKVIGTDLSPEMLAQALPHPQIEYLQSAAEAIPFPDASFDLITVSLAFHWFDRSRFFAEVNRLLQPGAWLVIYNNYFSGVMQNNPGFQKWNNERYLSRFPTPARHNQPVSDRDVEKYGLRFAQRETFANDVRFSAAELSAYLMTQSNVIAAVEQGTSTSEEVYQWLFDELHLIMGGQQGVFPFGGYIWFLQSDSSPS